MKHDNIKDWKTLETISFKKIYELCTLSYKYSLCYAMVADSGVGKTLTFDIFKGKHQNVHLIKLDKTMTPKGLYITMLQEVGIFDFNEYLNMSTLASKFAQTVKDQKEPCLFIYDEAGKFSAEMMEYFQTIRDRTENKMGIILAGTRVFKNKMDRWNREKKDGIPELLSRITSWEEIPNPTRNERYQVAKHNGITDPSIIKDIADSTQNFREVFNRVIEFRALQLESFKSSLQKVGP